MTEVLANGPTTVSGRDTWREAIQCVFFADETPVTRPFNRSEPFEALLQGPFSQTSCRIVAATVDGVWTHESNGPFTIEESAPAPTGGPVEHPGTIALRDLQEWLDMPLDSIVGLAGLGASTRAFWRNNPTAPVRPSKTGRFLRLHTAIGLLVGAQGVERARLTLRGEGWLSHDLDERRLTGLEARVRNELMPEGLNAPAYMSQGGLTRRQLRAHMLANTDNEQAQQALEQTATRLLPGHDAPESP